jgi:hypothetical protein
MEWEGKKREMDKTAEEIAGNAAKANESRKILATETRSKLNLSAPLQKRVVAQHLHNFFIIEFKKEGGGEAAVGALLKKYQSEIDFLSNRAKFAEVQTLSI